MVQFMKNMKFMHATFTGRNWTKLWSKHQKSFEMLQFWESNFLMKNRFLFISEIGWIRIQKPQVSALNRCKPYETMWRSWRNGFKAIYTWREFSMIARGMSNIFAAAWKAWIICTKCIPMKWSIWMVCKQNCLFICWVHDLTWICFFFVPGRTIVFAQASGVSLDGHVMLSTEDVQHNWLDVSDVNTFL